MSLAPNAEAFRAYCEAMTTMTDEDARALALLIPRKNNFESYSLSEALEIEPKLKARFDAEPMVRDLIERYSRMEENLAAEAKAEKLLHYATRSLREFIQIDAYGDSAMGDCVIDPQSRGNAIMSSITHELMAGAPVLRILITPSATKKEIVMALARIFDLIGNGGLLASVHPGFAEREIGF